MDATDLAVGTAVLCFILGLFYFKVKPLILRLALHVLVPAAIAYGVYWIPNLKYRNDIAYQGWDLVLVFVVVVFATPASIIADVLSTIVRRFIGQQPSPHDSSKAADGLTGTRDP